MPNNHAAQPEEDLVRLYLNDIGKHSLLTKDDEARLAQAIEGGREARAELASGKTLTAARKRELRRVVRDGDVAAETFVKANRRLSIMEMDALLQALAPLENPLTCPHGRPTALRITRARLEREFGRST